MKLLKYLLIAFIVILSVNQSQAQKSLEWKKVFEQSATWSSTGVDTLYGDQFSMYCDTIAFVIEVQNYAWVGWNDSTRKAVQALNQESIDSLAITVYGQFFPATGSGIADTVVIGGMTSLVGKLAPEGAAAWGAPVNVSFAKKNGMCRVWIVATNKRAKAVSASITIWAVKKFIYSYQ